jgi:CBS domain-containing protein
LTVTTLASRMLRLTDMTIREIMKRAPWTIGETDTLGNAQHLMSEHHIRHLPVVSGGILVGMLSERDLLQARAHADGDERWWKIPVHFAMQPAETAEIDELVDLVAGRMGSTKIGAVAVLERGRMCGVVSVIDVLLAHGVSEKMAPATTAADAMVAHPPTIRPEQSLVDAVRVMCEQHIRELPVTDENGVVVGMITEADVRRTVGDPASYLARSISHDPIDVQDIMETGVPPIREDRPLAEVAHYFADARLEALPIVDETGALVGLMSYLDTLNALAR